MIAKDLQNIHLNAKAIPNKIYKSRDDNGKIIYYIGTADRRLFPYNPTVKEVAKIIEIKEKTNTPVPVPVSETDPVFNTWLSTSPLSSYVQTSLTLSINGITQDLSTNRTYNVGDLLSTNNLSDLSNVQTSRSNLNFIRKLNTVDTSTSSTSYNDVTDMYFNVDSNQTYIFEMYGRMGSTSSQGGRLSIITPTGAIIEYQVLGSTGGSYNTYTGVSRNTSGSESITFASSTPLSTFLWFIKGSIITDSTAGVVKLQSKSMNAANTFTIYSGSVLKAEKIT